MAGINVLFFHTSVSFCHWPEQINYTGQLITCTHSNRLSFVTIDKMLKYKKLSFVTLVQHFICCLHSPAAWFPIRHASIPAILVLCQVHCCQNATKSDNLRHWVQVQRKLQEPCSTQSRILLSSLQKLFIEQNLLALVITVIFALETCYFIVTGLHKFWY